MSQFLEHLFRMTVCVCVKIDESPKMVGFLLVFFKTKTKTLQKEYPQTLPDFAIPLVLGLDTSVAPNPLPSAGRAGTDSGLGRGVLKIVLRFTMV